jgi:spore coat protein U-like protein
MYFMHTSKKVAATVAAGVMVALAGAAHAATKTDGFTVSVNVLKNCVIDATDMNLGDFVGDNDLTAQSSITVACTSGTLYSVALDAGSSADYGARTLVNGTGDELVYNLYTDALYQFVWGDDSGTTDVVGGTGAGMSATTTLPVYGRLRAADNNGAIADGVYTDTITATITY